VAGRRWKKLSRSGRWQQNLYEMTALVYDEKRDQLILHGGGAQRDELWTFDFPSGQWAQVDAQGVKPPVCRREAVYLPRHDVLLTCGCPAGEDEETAAVYAYRIEANTWDRLEIPTPPGRKLAEIVGQNRSMTYDPDRGLVLMILGDGPGDRGDVVVYALKYEQAGY
jgi:hypothetical protein